MFPCASAGGLLQRATNRHGPCICSFAREQPERSFLLLADFRGLPIGWRLRLSSNDRARRVREVHPFAVSPVVTRNTSARREQVLVSLCQNQDGSLQRFNPGPELHPTSEGRSIIERHLYGTSPANVPFQDAQAAPLPEVWGSLEQETAPLQTLSSNRRSMSIWTASL